MKLFISTILALFIIPQAFCQTDSLSSTIDTSSSSIDTSMVLSKKFTKGFYKNYNEFIDNSPSVTTGFTTVKKRIGKGLYRYKYDINDGEPKMKSWNWGFADDSLFYVHIEVSMWHSDYWKLECCAARYPFTFVKRDRSGMFYGIGIIADEISPYMDMYVINERGKAKIATRHYLKKLFSQVPEILESYLQAPKNTSNSVKQEFMISFNQYLASH